MINWTLLFYISSTIFIALFIVLKVLGLQRNKYLKPFKEDELFKNFKESDARNFIYSTNGITRKYIRRYVVRRGHYDTSILCNYNKNYGYISYYIVTYGKNKKVKEVFEVTETNTNTNSSKIFVIKKKFKYVNIVIKQVDGEEINTNFIKPIPRKKAKLYSFLSTIALLTFLFSLRHLLIFCVGEVFLEDFSNSVHNYIAMIAILVISLLYYITKYRSLKRRNFKNRIGGNLDYEFF